MVVEACKLHIGSNPVLTTYLKNNVMEIGDIFIGKLNNEYKDKILIVNERMLGDDESLCYFLHYYGFEKYSQVAEW